MSNNPLPVVVGISGASGAVYGVETLKALKALRRPAHLIATRAAERTLALETDTDVETLSQFADAVHDDADVAAPVASGSFRTAGMIVAPCSIKSLSGIVNGYADTLLIRAADATLKERRPLVLMTRETPLHKGHLDLMVRAADLGAVILPPMPAFYHRPKTIADIVRQTVGKALDQLDIDHDLFERWAGPGD